MAFNCDFHAVAHRFADIGNIGDTFFQILFADEVRYRPNRFGAGALPNRPAERCAKLVKGPDLHRFDAIAQQLGGQFPRAPFAPGMVVLIGAVANACIVDRNPLAITSAQQIVDRLAGGLAHNIPQRHIYRADGARLCPSVTEKVHGGEEIVPMVFNIKRAAAQ